MTSKMKENRILLFENTIYSMKSKILSIENTTNYNLEIQSQKKPFDNLQEIYQYLNKPPSYKEIAFYRDWVTPAL